MLTKVLRRGLVRPGVCARPRAADALRSRRCVATASSAPGSVPAADATAAQGQLALLTAELDRLAPRFEVDAQAVRVLRTPADFYETLKVGESATRQEGRGLMAW